MSHSPVSQGQCGSCGKTDRLLLLQEEDGHCYCNVCSLLVSIRRMTSRLDSETDHRIVRLYQDLQTAAQRFWSTPQGMNYQFSTGIADHLSIHPTPIMPTTRMTSNPAVLPPDDTLPPIIPPPTLIAHAGDPNLGCPHRTTALAPSIIVDTPIYNAFAPGTTQQTRHFSQIGIPTDWQVTPRAGSGSRPPPLFCFPPGSQCNYYHFQPIGYACTAFATHTCLACSTSICPGHSADCSQCGMGLLCHFCVMPSKITGTIPFHGKDPERQDKLVCTLDSTMIESPADPHSQQTGVWLVPLGSLSNPIGAASANTRRVRARLLPHPRDQT